MQAIVLRVFDVCFSFVGIVCGVPFMIVIYVLGLFDTGSPLFFQSRMGKNKRPFLLVKFRTMSVNTASVGTHEVDSNSITRLGGFLRKSKLDEFPQLVNVLLGQMSLVGPRPCLSSQAELINEREQRDVFKVLPGITGLAQIHEVDMSTPRKLALYDQLMIRKMTLNLYFGLIVATMLGQGGGDRVVKK